VAADASPRAGDGLDLIRGPSWGAVLSEVGPDAPAATGDLRLALVGAAALATQPTTMGTMESDPIGRPDVSACDQAQAGGRQVRAESLSLDRNLEWVTRFSSCS